MVKRNTTSTSSNNCLHWWERNLLPKIILFYKILPVHHDCNSNDQEHSHKLQTQAASSKIRNMNFCLKIKISVNSSQFRTIWKPNGQEKKKNASANNSLQLWERNLLPEIKKYYKILPVHHDCNPNDQEHSHKLQTQAASSKIRKMNFQFKIQLTVNSSWFQLCEPNINNLKAKWSREIAQAQNLNSFLK